MDPSELVKQPQDVTENPYRRSGKDKTGFNTAEDEVQRVSENKGFVLHFHFEEFETSSLCLPRLCVQAPAHQFFFDLSKKQDRGPRGRGRKRPSDGDGHQQGRRWEGDGRGRDQQQDGDGHQQHKQPRRHRESNMRNCNNMR